MKNSFLLLSSTVLFFQALSLSAARIYVETSKEDSTKYLIKLDTEGSTINTIDGTLSMTGFGKDISDISTGGSSFSLWPNKPSLSNSTISFTGGVPSGISGKDLLVFTIYAKVADQKLASITFKNVVVYANDGKATPSAVKSSTSKFPTASTTFATSSTPTDRTPPEPFSIELGKDDSLFDGKYFISFSTTDSDSGINHYEIQEGNNTPIRSGSPYVLQDQTLASNITVTAFDDVNNKMTSTFGATNPVNTQTATSAAIQTTSNEVSTLSPLAFLGLIFLAFILYAFLKIYLQRRSRRRK